MTGISRVFIDTAPIIYYLDKAPGYCWIMERYLDKCYTDGVSLFTSAVTIEEYCVYPYRNQKPELIERLLSFIDAAGVEVRDIEKSISLAAAALRAKYPGFKAMDAFQLECVVSVGADIFLTSDKQLRQCDEINVVLIDELQ